MSTTWNTKYGPRRVRHDPPTLEEAIFAARGLTDDLEDQVAIAAGLMELPLDDVRAAVRKSPPPRKPAATLAFTNRGGLHRSVVVERKTPRRPANEQNEARRSFGVRSWCTTPLASSVERAAIASASVPETSGAEKLVPTVTRLSPSV